MVLAAGRLSKGRQRRDGRRGRFHRHGRRSRQRLPPRIAPVLHSDTQDNGRKDGSHQDAFAQREEEHEACCKRASSARRVVPQMNTAPCQVCQTNPGRRAHRFFSRLATPFVAAALFLPPSCPANAQDRFRFAVRRDSRTRVAAGTEIGAGARSIFAGRARHGPCRSGGARSAHGPYLPGTRR